MEHLVFVWTAKGQKITKVPIDPAQFGAVKSQARDYKKPLWAESEFFNGKYRRNA